MCGEPCPRCAASHNRLGRHRAEVDLRADPGTEAVRGLDRRGRLVARRDAVAMTVPAGITVLGVFFSRRMPRGVDTSAN